MITPMAIREFTANLAAISNNGSRICDMGELSILKDCSAPLCHAGWAYLALTPKAQKAQKAHYKTGAHLLSKSLGLAYADDLKSWAHCNSDIWGNDHGAMMFKSSLAFGLTNPVFPVKVIIDHWNGVARRLK